MSDESYNIAMIGAGPAALYSADKLAGEGHEVVILNRDIKPGGLAEFGIYPTKHRMKGGLRKMFRRILAKDNVHYFGNVKVGKEADISLEAVREMGFDATVVAVGAQGTRWLGLPGEEADKVYHAKDLVYHFNQLPPFAERDYPIGDEVCIVGLGNVCLDIVHWLTCEKKTGCVRAVYRRGPAERPCTKRELKIVSGAMDLEQIREEFDQIGQRLEAVGQDPEEEFEDLTKNADEPLEAESPSDFEFRFLSSPERIELDEDGEVEGLTVEQTQLIPPEQEDERPGIEGTGTHETISCDTVVFAIGDSVEPSLGLPLDPERADEFATVPQPWEAHPDRPRYMVWQPEAEEPMWGTFVVGWARKASDGLVGKAKQDGETGCDEVLAYLEGEFDVQPNKKRDIDELLADMHDRLESVETRYVTMPDVEALEAVEEREAERRDVEEFKFSTNEEMLEAIESERGQQMARATAE